MVLAVLFLSHQHDLEGLSRHEQAVVNDVTEKEERCVIYLT